MSKKTYIIFHTDGTIEKTSVLDEEICEGLDTGTIKVVDPKKWKFLNDDEWDDIPEREVDESLDDVDIQDFDEDELEF